MELFNDGIAPLRVTRVVKPELQGFTGPTVVEAASERGKDVIDSMLDLVLENDFRTEFLAATMNTDAGSVAEIFAHPTAVLGLSDAGAHITMFSRAGQTSQLLGHCVRERQALSLEASVRLITGASGIQWSFVNGQPNIRDEGPPEAQEVKIEAPTGQLEPDSKIAVFSIAVANG